MNITLKQQSWHYRLATVYNTIPIKTGYDYGKGEWVEKPLDFCTYSNSVIVGLIHIILGMIAGLTCIGIPFTDFLMWASASIDTNTLISPDVWGETFILFVFAMTVALALYQTMEAIEEWSYERYLQKMRHQEEIGNVPQATFMSALYRKIKEKTCFLVTFN